MFYAVSRLAVHIDAQVLNMAALLKEFRARLRELVEAGESYEAALVWGSVLEVQHYPPPPAGLLEGLFRASPLLDAAGAKEAWGGLQFPFVGTFLPGVQLSLPMGLRRLKPGMPTIAMARCGYLSKVFSVSGLHIYCRTTPIDFFVIFRARSILRERPRSSSGLFGGTGIVASGCGVSRAMRQYHLWPSNGSIPKRGRIVPFGFSSAPWWQGWRCCPLPVAAVGARHLQCRLCTSPVCRDCLAQCTRCS